MTTKRKKRTKKKKGDYWDNDLMGDAMGKYRLAHTVTSTPIPGQTKLQRDIVLKNPSEYAEMQKLYNDVIYPAHKRLTVAFLEYKNIDKEYREQMTDDIVTYLYEVMMLWWDPAAKTSSYSYFASAISTNISHFYSGKMACSPQWTAEKEAEFILRDVKIGDKTVKQISKAIVKEMAKVGMVEGQDYHLKEYGGGGNKGVKAVHYKRVHRHHLDDEDDISQGPSLGIWEDICLKTLSEYVPDVVIAKKYHSLAFAVLDFLGDIIDGTCDAKIGRRLDFWLLSRVQLEVGWAVTQYDLKMTFYVIRKAFEYYLEDFPLEKQTEYGDCGLIIGAKDSCV